jgi:soluble lytic murein transglycosylase
MTPRRFGLFRVLLFILIGIAAPCAARAGAPGDADIQRYRDIFDLQSRAEFTAAAEILLQVDYSLLKGHVLAQKYLHAQSRRATFQELKDWLGEYGDHPQAARIYKLAAARGDATSLKEPPPRTILYGSSDNIYAPPKAYRPQVRRTDEEQAQIKTLESNVRQWVRGYSADKALESIKKEPAFALMDMVEKDILRAQIAAGYLYAGEIDRAKSLSGDVLRRSGKYAPMAGWVNGIARWRDREYESSAKSFETAATSPYASAWMISGAAFWASRAHLRTGNMKSVSKWLKIAAEHPHTFYGLIAIRALGQDPEFDWTEPSLSGAMENKILKHAAGQRAAALIRAGQISLAEQELEVLATKKDKSLRMALLAYARAHDLPALSLKMGHVLTRRGGALYDSALYPFVPWTPEKGYTPDKALVHAFMRQESRFNTLAENPSGATGLMQILPSTAESLSGGNDPRPLTDPARNIELGQRYLEKLLADRAVARDLLSLAVAYNAGPGKLSKWKSERKTMTDDVLLFIETIPYSETRAFVEHVLANFWIYRLKSGLPTPTLDAVTEGKWAVYDLPLSP